MGRLDHFGICSPGNEGSDLASEILPIVIVQGEGLAVPVTGVPLDSPHVSANPDLGNIYWTYDVPEESSEDAVLALAPHSKYWHCKNLHRVYIAENEHSNFIRVPLPDGDIDYRFAINAMQDAGYDGYLAIEGANLGDQLHADRRSVEYVQEILSEPR